MENQLLLLAGRAPAAPTRRSWVKRLSAALGGLLLGGPALARAARRGPTQGSGGFPFVGEIMVCAFNFAPKGYAMCNGQLLPINQNNALFALLGTKYGGDGRNTFGLPDLRGRTPRHQGNNYVIGASGGTTTVVLPASALPSHTHPDNVSAAAGTSSSPVGNVLAPVASTNLNGEAVTVLAYGTGVAASGPATSSTGGAATPIVAPFLTLNYCIALVGQFPSRS